MWEKNLQEDILTGSVGFVRCVYRQNLPRPVTNQLVYNLFLWRDSVGGKIAPQENLTLKSETQIFIQME